MMRILTAIRHTRVTVPPGVCYGQSDVALAKTYAEEMAAVKTQTDWYRFEAVYCSPLARCRQLAEDLFPGQAIGFDPRLMELNFGQWEMQPWDTISQTPRAQAWFADYVNVRTPGGESFADLIGRTGAFLDELKQQPFQNVAIVAHGGIVRALDCLINGTDPIDAFKSNVDYGQLIDFNL